MSQSIKTYQCYIEEYTNDSGQLCARLRDRDSGKKIIFDANEHDRVKLLMFLSHCKIFGDTYYTVEPSNEYICARGYVREETDSEIFISDNYFREWYIV